MSEELPLPCVYCKTIAQYQRNNKDIDDLTLNGWQAARHVHALAYISDPAQLEEFDKLTSTELSEGRWCKGCYKKIK